MAYSFVSHVGETGAATDYALPFGFISRDHVTATVDEVSASFTWLSDSMIRMDVAPVGDLKITRTTPITSRSVTFVDGSTHSASKHNLQNLQLLYVAQEVADDLENAMQSDGIYWDALTRQIKNVVDPTDAQDAVTKTWAETAMSSELAGAIAAQVAALAAQAAAEAAQTASEAAQTAAELAETNADASEVAAAADAAQVAADKATVAADKAAAAASASSASTDAGTATTKASEASASAAAATASASAAATSASNASTSEGNASTSETNAATSAAEAAANAAGMDPTKLAAISENADVTQDVLNAAAIHTTISDAEEVVKLSASVVRRITWANIKSNLKTYFDALYASLSGAVFTGNVTVKETTDTQYSLTGTVIDPANGNIQYKTLGANTTFTESLANGQTVALYIDDGTAYTITWPTMTWWTSDGLAPALVTTGYNVFVLQKRGGVLYGKGVHVG